MTLKKNAVITAIGGYVPDHILDNKALEGMMDTTDEWITARTGIAERRIVKEEGICTSDMAANAVKDLIAQSGLNPLDVDCLILATSTPDHVLLPAATAVCLKAGLTNAWALDVNAACSGFLYALSTGGAFVESGRYKNVIVIGADQMSAIINYGDRNTSILFGDGAGAVLLQPSDNNEGIIDNVFKSDGNGGQYLQVPAGGSLYKSTQETIDGKLHYITQDGRVVFKAAINGMSSVCKEVMERNNLTSEDVDWVIPHQANLRIIQAVGERLNIPIEKVKVNIQKYGNTTAATIPLCLWDFKNDFKPGDNILLTAFGAGFTWGATFVKWGELKK